MTYPVTMSLSGLYAKESLNLQLQQVNKKTVPNFDEVMLGQVKKGLFKLGQVRLGYIRLGYVRLGQ